MRFDVIKRDRIRIALAALAYEHYNKSIMSDADYDRLAHKVYLARHQTTKHPQLDKFFRTQFSPHTALWIYKHPDLKGLHNILKNVFLLTRKNHRVITHGSEGKIHDNRKRSPQRARGRYK